MAKTVRVTVELSPRALRLLMAKVELSSWNRWMPGYDGVEPPKVLDIGGLLCLMVYMEAQGCPPADIHVATPHEWREEGAAPILIHDERRVYEDGKLIGSGS